MAEQGSRWGASVRTFGPVGRLACTALLLLVLWWFQRTPFGWLGAIMWLFFVMPWALRDIWRPAQLPPTDLTRLRDAEALRIAWESREPESNPALDPNGTPPRRW
jgi:hypothetical protein